VTILSAFVGKMFSGFSAARWGLESRRAFRQGPAVFSWLDLHRSGLGVFQGAAKGKIIQSRSTAANDERINRSRAKRTFWMMLSFLSGPAGIRKIGICLFLVLCVLAPHGVGAEDRSATIRPAHHDPPLPRGGAIPEKSELENLSVKISSATGLAISPLVVAGCLGSYQWWVTAPEDRPRLSLFCHPLAWGTFLGLGLLFLANSFIGSAIPILKKPMDFVETIEHAVSGLLIGLPLMILMKIPASLVVSGLDAPAVGTVAGFVLPISAVPVSVSAALTWFFWVPVLGLCFVSVWALSQFVNLLILLSPWGGLDLLLRALRGATLGLIFLATLISPWLALLFCLLIIVVALLMLRLTWRACHFAAYLAWDIFWGVVKPRRKLNGFVRAYALASWGEVRKGTLGKLEISQDGIVRFCYGRNKSSLLGEGLELKDGWLGGIIVDARSLPPKNLLRISKRFRCLHQEVALRYGLIPPVQVLGSSQVTSSHTAWTGERSLGGAVESWRGLLSRIVAEIKIGIQSGSD